MSSPAIPEFVKDGEFSYSFWHDYWPDFPAYSLKISKNTVIAKIFCLLLLLTPFLEESETAELAYLKSHEHLAIREMDKHGIPASITLAQALVESDAGRSVLAIRANNHFGIKCKSWWNGGQYFYADDDRNASGELTASCFRIYESVSHSFEDHSLFLKGSERYASLFDYELTDYQKWATGLQNCGYATNSRYSKRLIQLIEKYRLYELDQKSQQILSSE